MNPAPAARIEILLPRPFDTGFDYQVPDGMSLVAGDYVSVPFGKQQMLGVVWGPAKGDVPLAKCKPVAIHHAAIPPMSDAMRDFIDRTATYVMAPRGMVLKMALPQPKAILSPPLQTSYHASPDHDPTLLSPRRRDALLWLRANSHASKQALVKETGLSPAMLRSMLATGEIIMQEQLSAPMAPAFHFASPPILMPEQIAAATRLSAMLGKGFDALVLDGVTGSGKTEIYFDAIEALLRDAAGGQVLVLLPEIGLTVQWLARFEARFGVRPHLWHSNLTEKQRRDTAYAVMKGAARLVVGARSALYLPFANLSLIVVDEEHEPTYKQEEGVCYQARDMAVLRAKLEGVPVVLASATPSCETMQNVAQGKYHYVSLPTRFGPQDMPAITLLDMRDQPMERGGWLSDTLRRAMTDTLSQGAQSMVFLNRRGYAPLLLCRHCGHRFQCPNCSTWMVQHQRPPRLHCHHCDTRTPLPDTCPACQAEADQLVACGPGVERLEEEVQALFPQARVAVLTSDESDLAAQLHAILNHETDIIIGTQLVAKGHHFPKLALVGVVDADLGLVGGDLRASERTYQLLHQVAGRAGREAIKGQVFLQTYQPHHPVMQALASWNREDFMKEEMAAREAGGWPPFGRLAALLLDGPSESAVSQVARQLAAAAPRYEGVRVLGPTPAPLARLRQHYRYRLLIKTDRQVALQQVVREWVARVPIPHSVRLKIDIDPYYFL